LIVTADALPLIVLGVAFACSTCFKLKKADELADIATPLNTAVPSRFKVNVPADAAVFVTTMSVTTVVVLVVGTVYSVVLLTAAAVLASVLLVVAISYYLS
jgi:hypothetical protein